jgi:hypothetical protein
MYYPKDLLVAVISIRFKQPLTIIIVWNFDSTLSTSSVIDTGETVNLETTSTSFDPVMWFHDSMIF